MDKLAIVDIETSGNSPLIDRVIEVGLVLVDKGEVSKTWSSLVNPGQSINPFITTITGIRQEDLVGAPSFENIYEELLDMLEGRIFVAHNVRFDYGFLKREFHRMGEDLMQPHACSVRLSRHLFPEHSGHGLDKLIDRFEIECEGRHRALGDAKVVWDFMQIAKKIKGEELVTKTFETIVSKPALPSNLKQAEIDTLPACPGIYIFYGDDDGVLYVGKSINVRERVKQHFYSDLRNSKELRLKNLVSHIEAQTCAGELSALLRESDLIKELEPQYNKALRKRKSYTLGLLQKDDEGYLRVVIEDRETIEVDDIGKIYGVFRSKKQAEKYLLKLVKEFGLCMKLVGLESGEGACFGSQLENCAGACVSKESFEEYNKKVLAAFERSRIMHWKFGRMIGVKEYNDVTEESILHVFDKWCLLASVSSEAELEEQDLDKIERKFDLDVYHILRRYLKGKALGVVELG